MKYIIYHSTASIYFRSENLEQMMLKFRNNNAKNSITGLLLYSGTAFLQLLEGEDAVIDKTMKRIRKNKIHHSIIVLLDAKSETRMFPDWSMGFKSMPSRQFEEIKQLLQPVLLPAEKAGFSEKHPIISYFEGFIANTSIRLKAS